MTPLEYFRLLVPAFSELSDAEVLEFLVVAENFVNVGCLTTEPANLARAMYAAHLLFERQASNSAVIGGGAVVREKEGDLEREYSSNAEVVYGLEGNPYGRRYLELIRPCAGGPTIMTRMGAEGYLWPNLGAWGQ